MTPRQGGNESCARTGAFAWDEGTEALPSPPVIPRLDRGIQARWYRCSKAPSISLPLNGFQGACPLAGAGISQPQEAVAHGAQRRPKGAAQDVPHCALLSLLDGFDKIAFPRLFARMNPV